MISAVHTTSRGARQRANNRHTQLVEAAALVFRQ